jgi:hypothetical protein
MTKSRLEEAHRDLVAAARLGSRQALATAVEAFAALPPFRGNERLDRATLNRTLPRLGDDLGRALAAGQAEEALQALAHHKRAAVRCLAAWALPSVWGASGALRLAEQLSTDRREEVRASLAQALEGLPQSERQALAEAWLRAPQASRRTIALRLIPARPALVALGHIEAGRAETHPAVQAALVEALVRIASEDSGAVFTALERWTFGAGEAEARLIVRTIARAPLRRNLARSSAVLGSLTSHASADVMRHVISGFRALAREGDVARVRRVLEEWSSSEDPARREVAARALRRLHDA